LRKKLNSLILVLAMVAALLVPCFAADTPTFEVKAPETLPKKGETFTVTVYIKDNPGISAFTMILKYNREQMGCIKVVSGEATSGLMTAENQAAEPGAMVAGAGSTNVTADGIIATYTFKAKTDIDAFSFSLLVETLADAEKRNVDYLVTYNWDNSTDSEDTTDKTEDKDPDEEEDEEDKPEQKPVDVSFTDISTHWGKENILKAAELGLFAGYSDGTFRPNADVTRGQFVTVIWRLAGSPEPTAAEPFTDVKDSDYFAKAVAWAYNIGLVNGTSATEFSPNAPLTREAAMKILFLYSGGVSGMELMLTTVYDQCYQDSGKIASWAKAAMYWGVYNSIISGVSTDTIAPKGHATRAQLATILVNYIETFNVQV